MRSSAIAVAITIAACSSTPATPNQEADAGVLSDALVASDAALAAVDAAVMDDAPPPPPPPAFLIASPPLSIDPAGDITFCFYFRTPNATALSIKRWASHMTPGVQHMIVYLTPTKQKEPGTMSADDCGLGTGGTGPVWTYSAQAADAEAVLPPDDGAGKPVGQPIIAGQYGFIQIHYVNPTASAIQAHVELSADAYDSGIAVTPAAPFVTYNDKINIPPGTPTSPSRAMVSGTCDFTSFATTPLKFYVVSTHTHKQGSHTLVADGAQTVFDSTNWLNPGASTWNQAPFFTFTTNKLTYTCEYVNTNTRTIVDGDNAATEEVCMAIGYYFPAGGSSGHLCLDSAMMY